MKASWKADQVAPYWQQQNPQASCLRKNDVVTPAPSPSNHILLTSHVAHSQLIQEVRESDLPSEDKKPSLKDLRQKCTNYLKWPFRNLQL